MPAKHNAKFNLPPELQDWFVQEIDEKGKSAIAASEWWNSECNTKLNSGEWKNKWPSYGSHGQDEEFVHRESLPLHYVVGRMSPFFIERLLKNDNSRAIWAIYFGPYTSNARGATRTGVAQGGAVATVFDIMTAQLAAEYIHGAHTPTTQIVVNLMRPTRPIPGVFRAECWVESDTDKRIILKGELSDGHGNVTCTCQFTVARVKKKSRL